jgi:hypothetical protein
MENTTPYEELLEERQAFFAAGMVNKVKEWDYKINVKELEGKYKRITLRDIANELGIGGLQKAVDEKIAEQNAAIAKQNAAAKAKVAELNLKAKDICKDILKLPTISEAKMYAFIDMHSFRWANDPELTAAIMELLSPKLNGTIKHLFKQIFMINAKKIVTNLKNPEADKVAFMKIERVADYKQNDNPPMMELMKAVVANVSGIFDELYIAYPMIDRLKHIDPIIFGVKKDPLKKYDDLNGWKDHHTTGIGYMANNEITLERIDSLNFGDLFHVAQWM